MTSHAVEDTPATAIVDAVRRTLEGEVHGEAFDRAQQQLLTLARAARDAERLELEDAARVLAQLLKIAQSRDAAAISGTGFQPVLPEEHSGNLPRGADCEPVDFVRRRLAELEPALHAGTDDTFRQITDHAWRTFGECLAILNDQASSPWDRNEVWRALVAARQESPPPDVPDQPAAPPSEAIQRLLAALETLAPDAHAVPSESGDSVADPADRAGRGSPDSVARGSPDSVGRGSPDSAGSAEPGRAGRRLGAGRRSPDLAPFPDAPAAMPDLEEIQDPELKDAFLDDARRCVASIEQSALDWESDPHHGEPLRQLCRELHTLKGAAATVGLDNLARYLHRLEDNLQSGDHAEPGLPTADAVLACVDVIRRQIQHLEASPSATGFERRDRSSAGLGPAVEFHATPDANAGSVRVRSSQLQRLMDSLADLVMLRNRRDNQVERLKEVEAELSRCVVRLRSCDELDPLSQCGGSRWRPASAASAAASAAAPPAAPRNWNFDASSRDLAGSGTPHRAGVLREIASDLLELSRSLRQLYQPIADENLAVSQFIRQFRQELVELRRAPVSGLFQRLQRAARDAAAKEHKQVRMQIQGEHAGLDRSVQETLYEPLLHIVRNAVSHGIEPAPQRLAAGKDAVGTITLEAHGGPNLLAITVRDDGHGLDYDALRRRGLEAGLLSPDRPASYQELAGLIYQPGFSTRRQATSVAGRGVGLDVVAATLQRMHGWVDVDSTPGKGTTFRLHIPLPSVIEHTLLFRAGHQLLAIPMRWIKAATASSDPPDGPFAPAAPDTEHSAGSIPTVCFAQILGRSDAANRETHQLVLQPPRAWPRRDGSTGSPANWTDEDTDQPLVAIRVDQILGPEEVVVRPLPPLLGHQTLLAGLTVAGNGQIVLLLDDEQLYARTRQILAHVPQPDEDTGCGVGRPTHSAVPQTTTPPQLTPPRILIVDDSLSARRVLTQLARRTGLDADEAPDGAAALVLLRKHPYAAVLTDLEMPRLNGLELLREIKTHPQLARVPVVVVSSCDDEEPRRRAEAMGAYRFLAKPVNESALSETLKEIGTTSCKSGVGHA